LRERIRLAHGDIVGFQGDAIVNAANTTLLGGGGVDGAIHRAAGPELLAECRTLGGCTTGDAKITRGYHLPVQWVIHTVGPVWRGGAFDEERLLAQCHSRSLELAEEHGMRSIAFPAISTGVYGFPVDRAAAIALEATWRYLQSSTIPEEVVFVLFTKRDLEIWQQELAELNARLE
jgi:O-acetyl-ADP-ribose deacetylase (regulator of RNase III)